MDNLQFDVLEPERLGSRLTEDSGHSLIFDAPLIPVRSQASGSTTEHKPSIQELHLEAPKNSNGPPKNGDQPPSVLSLVAPYCDVKTLFNLALVSHEVRRAATEDNIWIPICRKLGIADTKSDRDDLICYASPFNVLDLGYTVGERSAYTTFCRAYSVLRPVLANAKEAVSSKDRQVPMNHIDKANLLTGAIKLSNALSWSDDVSEGETSNLNAVVEEEEEDLRDELSHLIEKNEPLSPVFAAYNVWWQRLGRDDMRQKAIDIYFSNHSIEWDAEEAFSFESRSDSKTVSARKLSIFFQTLASYLSGSARTLTDPSSGIPHSWHNFMRSVFLDRFTRLVGDYVTEVLHLAQNISEREYLAAVPKIYSASRSLMDNDVLRSSSDWGECNIKEMLSAYFLDSMVDEFCTRQLQHFESTASEMVEAWRKSVSEKESETERFLWSSVPRKRDKTKFVTTFKWAVSSLNMQEDREETDNGLDLSATEALSAPQTEFEAQTAVLVSKFKGMESLVSLELVINILESCRASFHRFKTVEKEQSQLFEPMFVTLVDIVGRLHIRHAFEKAIKVLNAYDPKRFGRLVISLDNLDEDTEENERTKESKSAVDKLKQKGGVVEPLMMFTELVNVGDLVQQMLHVFFEEELVSTHIVRKSNFASPSVSSKRKFEQMIDDMLAEGLSRGIDVLMDQVEFTLVTEQLGSDYLPVPTQEVNLGPTVAALKVIDLVKSHFELLKDSTEKTLFDVFQQEVGMRLFTAISKHIKAQTVSVDGAVTLISDLNAYYAFMLSLKQKTLYPYYEALKQVGQLYLVDTRDAKQLGLAVSDVSRYNGVISTEELVEFLKRRQDWLLVRGKVERVLYGMFECVIC